MMNETNIIELETAQTPFDGQAIVDKFRDFYQRSRKKNGSIYERMKADRKFLGGSTMWDDCPKKAFRSKAARLTLNVIANATNSVINQYSAYPFGLYTGTREDDAILDGLIKPCNHEVEQALKNEVTLGLGVFALGSDKRDLPTLYAIPDFERVVLDPDSTDMTGEDQVECGLIDYRGRRWVELNYGPEFVPTEREANIVPCMRDLVPIVTYYVMEDDGYCHVYTLVNNQAIDGGNTGLTRIPVFPCYGERNFDEEGELSWSGMVAQSKTIQKIVNMSISQLGARLMLSPKPVWMGSVDSMKGLDRYYKEAPYGDVTMLPYNRKSPDGRENVDPPQRFEQRVPLDDLSNIIGNTLNLMGSVTGVDSHGLVDQSTQKTATEISYSANVFQNQTRHYFMHLMASFEAAGRMLAQAAGIENEVHVCQGPMEWAGLQQARAEITQLIGVAEPNQKPALIDALIQTYPENRVMANLYATLHSIPTPTPMEAQMQQTCEMMKQKIDQQAQQMQQMDQQIKYYEQQINNQDKNIQAELVKMQYNHQAKMEEMALQAQLEGNTAAAQVEADAAKAQVEIEKQALDLELAERKARGEIAVQDAKNRLAIDKANIDLAVNRAKGAAQIRNANRKPEDKPEAKGDEE